MVVKCAWASIDERGKISGGKAGDQTGKEVRTGNWYKFGQTVVYRWKDRKKAQAFATCAETLANNSAIGYDQGQRTTLNASLKRLSWNYKKLKTPCECDCSAFVVACVNCVAKKELLSPKLYTGNIGEALMKTGYFEKLSGSRYCSSDSYLMIGDIINAPGSHVIISLADGSKTIAERKKAEKNGEEKRRRKSAKKKKTNKQIAKEVIAGKWGNGETRKAKLKKAGYDYKEVQKAVNKLMK